MPTNDRNQSGKQDQGNRQNQTDQDRERSKQTAGTEGRDTKSNMPGSSTDHPQKGSPSRDNR